MPRASHLDGRLAAVAGIAGFMVAAAGQAIGGEAIVRSPHELYGALAAAKPGDRILLAEGSYGELNLSAKSANWMAGGPAITIASLDAGKPAQFSNLLLNAVGMLVLDNLLFEYEAKPDDTTNTTPNSIEKVSGVTISNSRFDGNWKKEAETQRAGPPIGRGLWISESQNIELRGNDFRNWSRGVVFAEDRALRVLGNDIHDIGSDGMDFASVQDVLIEANHIHDFVTGNKDDHADMIQFWTAGTTTPTANVTIRGNLLDQGGGPVTQSIFMRNELVDQGLAGLEMFYRNLRIEDNVIRNGHVHGITAGETDGLVISRNTLLQSVTIEEGGTVSVPAIIVAENARHVMIMHNVISRIIPETPPRSDWEVNGNVFVQRQNSALPNHYRSIFVDAETKGQILLSDLRQLPGSLAAMKGAGAPMLNFDVHPRQPDGYIVNHTSSASGLVQAFDAGNVFGYAGNIARASFKWEFGDGQSDTGKTITHRYQQPGTYAVRVAINFESGGTLQLRRTVVIAQH